jgi:CD109 antigen
VFTRNGVFSGQLQLSPNPPLGQWKLVVQVLQQRFERRFQVSQYRLPSFEADLLLPSYATYNRSRVLATCSGHHLHGKPVQGECILTVRPHSRYFSSSVRPLRQLHVSRVLSNGRADFELDLLRDLKLGSELYEREIEFSAQVQEQHSGRTRNTSRTLRLYEHELKVDLLRESSNFKPGLPFHFKVRVSHPDDTPYVPEEPFRSAESSASTLLLPNSDPKLLKLFYGYSYNEENYTQTLELRIHNGIAEGTVYPLRDEQLLILGMRAEHLGLSYNLEPTEAAQTLSSHHIQVRSPTLTSGVQLGQRVKITVNGTETLPVLVYQVVARGELVYAGSIDATGSRETHFELQITHKMAPKARLIVHYARQSDHELLLDSIVFNVDGLFRTSVQVLVNVAQYVQVHFSVFLTISVYNNEFNPFDFLCSKSQTGRAN